jgi:hypothetical protein
MKLTRPAAVPERDTDAGPTHILHWVPGYVTSTGCGSWDLQDAAAYEAREPGGRDPEYDAPRDTPAAELALWAAGQLGYPVELEPASAAIRAITLRPLSVHMDTEPVYYVRVASGQEDPE